MHLNPAEYVITMFGGVRASARAVGRSRGSVSNWRRRGRIPAKTMYRILEIARERGLDITATDLIEGRFMPGDAGNNSEVPFP